MAHSYRGPSRSDTASPFDHEESPQNFEFVNFDSSTPALKDPNQRKVIRAHVVRDWSRRKKLQRLQSDKLKGRKIQPSLVSAEDSTRQVHEPSQEYFHVQQSTQRSVEVLQASTPAIEAAQPCRAEEETTHREDASPILERVPGFFELASPFSGLCNLLLQQPDPIPQLTPVLNHARDMGLAMYPLSHVFKFNPVCPEGSLGWHMDDKAAYHGALFATATYANLISGRPESREAVESMGKVVAMVNARLKEISESDQADGVGEGLIGAVASIALAESLKGNFDGWRIHMTGVKQLASLRGGISMLSTNLRHKLYRADLTGAKGTLGGTFFTGMDSPYRPFNPIATSHPSSGYSPSPPPVNISLHSTLASLPITQGLRTILITMSVLFNNIAHEISSRAKCTPNQQAQILEQTYSLQYSLLRPWSENEWNDDLHPMEECLRVASLLYLRATWQEFPFSLPGAAKLLERLRELVVQVEVSGETEEGLMVWLLFVGAIAAAKGDSRIWFVANLQRLVDPLHLDNWETTKSKLEPLWWIERIHGKLCKPVWDEVVVLNSVMIGI